MKSIEIEVRSADPFSETSRSLINELTVELAIRYKVVYDGSGAFNLEDATGERAGFYIAW